MSAATGYRRPQGAGKYRGRYRWNLWPEINCTSRSFPAERPLGPRQRLQEWSLPTRWNGCNDFPLKHAGGPRFPTWFRPGPSDPAGAPGTDAAPAPPAARWPGAFVVPIRRPDPQKNRRITAIRPRNCGSWAKAVAAKARKHSPGLSHRRAVPWQASGGVLIGDSPGEAQRLK
jgi:hypothetical protein